MNPIKHRMSLCWLSLSLGASLSLACAGAYEQDGAEVDPAEDEIGALLAPISGGALVTPAENGDPTKPFGSVVEINNRCTAVKIGANRFLTASHCISAQATTVRLSNGLTGAAVPAPDLHVTKVFVHPSFQLAGTFDDLVDRGVYEVSMFDIQESTSAIPIASVTGQEFLPGAGNMTLVGYGCDTQNANNSNKKQKAAFVLGQAASLAQHVHELAENSSANSCSGDSGGPMFANTTLGFRIAGIVAGAPVLTRISNCFEWINNPGENVIADQSGGYLMSGQTSNAAGFPEQNCVAKIKDPPLPQAPATGVKLDHCDGPDGTFSGSQPAWRLFNSSTGGGHFRLSNRVTSRCLAVDAASAANEIVTAIPCVADSATLANRQSQAWHFDDLGVAGTTPTTGVPRLHFFRVRNELRNKCLTTTNGSAAAGAIVRVATCDATKPDQSWVFTR